MQERITNKKIKGLLLGHFHILDQEEENFSISSDAYQIARMMKNLQDKTY